MTKEPHITDAAKDEPDVLAEALEATGDDEAKQRAWRLRAQLAERGYEIRRKGESE